MYKYLLPPSAVLAAAVLLLPVQAAQAATTNGSFMVSATIIDSCVVESPVNTTLNFGQRALLDTNLDASVAIRVRCNAGTKYHVGLGQGQNNDRRLRMGTSANYIDYELFTDNARTTPWPGPAAAGTDLTLTGNGTPQDITVFGRIPPQTTPPAGSYTDTVAITVTY